MNISILTIEVRSEHDVMLTRQRVRQIAGLLGFEMRDQTRIATAVSEIARNAVQHAGQGRIEFRLVGATSQVLEIRIKDDGPGISDLENLLRGRKSTPPECGATLRGVRRLMDEFLIETDPTKGTLVTLGKRRYRHLPVIERKDMARISGELTQRISEDPLAEMQRQNQELLHTLEELRVQQEERAEHLKEIEMLNQRLRRSMTETHHRVKNNLQIIASLIDMQKESGEQMVPVSEFARLGQNVLALGVIHDILTQEAKVDADVSLISVKGVLAQFLPLLQSTLGERHLLTHIGEVSLPVKQITSLVLIANELVSNAVKHGTGEVELSLDITGCTITLEVCDDGPGFSAGFNPVISAHTGLELVENIARYDLQAEISYEHRPQGGARIVMTFPVSD